MLLHLRCRHSEILPFLPLIATEVAIKGRKREYLKTYTLTYLFQIQKGKYLKVRLHSCLYTIKALPLQLITVLYLSQVFLKMKHLMPDSILPFFSGSREIPTEFLQEKKILLT